VRLLALPVLIWVMPTQICPMFDNAAAAEAYRLRHVRAELQPTVSRFQFQVFLFGF
jgi:ABC-type polysaccharide transport system permease subunit